MAGSICAFSSQKLVVNGDTYRKGWILIPDATPFQLGATVTLAGTVTAGVNYEIVDIDYVGGQIGLKALYTGTQALNGLNYGYSPTSAFTIADNATITQNAQFIYSTSYNANTASLVSAAGLQVSILPGGPTTALIANPAGLPTDATGKTFTWVRSTAAFARTGTNGDPSNFIPNPDLVQINYTDGASFVDSANPAPGIYASSRLVDSATSGEHGVAAINVVGLNTAAAWTVSAYLKAGTSGFANIEEGAGGQGATFNLSTGATVFTYGTVTTSSASLGGGWWRLTVSFTGSGGASDNVYILNNPTGANSNSPSYLGSGLYFFLAGLKAEPGSSATAYVSPMLRSIPANVARVEPEGILMEGSATNTTQWSQDLGNAAWSKTGSTATSNFGISPDGTLTATRLQLTAAAQSASFAVITSTNTTPSGQKFVVSGYVRSNTGGNQTFALRQTYSAVADYFSSDFTATNFWQRFSFVQQFPANASTACTSGICTGSGALAADLQVYGMQYELAVGSGVGTSYQPTTSGSSTRSYDWPTIPVTGTAAASYSVDITPQWSGLDAGGTTFLQHLAAGSAVSSAQYEPGDVDWATFIGSTYINAGGVFAKGVRKHYVQTWTNTAKKFSNITDGTSNSATYSSSGTITADTLRFGTNTAVGPYWFQNFKYFTTAGSAK